VGPAHRYYGSLVGSWRGPFVLSVTNAEAARAVPFPLRMAAWVGSFTMSTTLSGSGNTYEHTTRVHRLGMTLMRTRESIDIAEDGKSFVMSGEQDPSIGPKVPYEGTGEIDDGATGATYRITWAQMPLTQTTRIVPEGLELLQETAWSRGFVLLRRRLISAA
jgi:hypothetical protein